MNVLFHLGPVVGLLACPALALPFFFRHQKKTLPKPRPVSEKTQKSLDIVGDQLNPLNVPAETIGSIPVLDVLALYLNSRGNRRAANQAHVDRGRPDCTMFLDRIEADHTKVRNLAIFVVFEPFVGRLIICKSPRLLLWTYAEEQELLSNLADCCDHDDQQVLLSRL